MCLKLILFPVEVRKHSQVYGNFYVYKRVAQRKLSFFFIINSQRAAAMFAITVWMREYKFISGDSQFL